MSQIFQKNPIEKIDTVYLHYDTIDKQIDSG